MSLKDLLVRIFISSRYNMYTKSNSIFLIKYTSIIYSIIIRKKCILEWNTNDLPIYSWSKIALWMRLFDFSGFKSKRIFYIEGRRNSFSVVFSLGTSSRRWPVPDNNRAARDRRGTRDSEWGYASQGTDIYPHLRILERNREWYIWTPVLLCEEHQGPG